MYADLNERIEKVRGQIESVSYKMIEAEGDDYEALEAKLERLEGKLERLMIMSDDMDSVRSFDE